MNYIKHLTGFFEKVAIDKSLNPTHVSLYIALFQFWNYNRFRNPISISRDEVMRISKISSKATYHKCLHNLHDKGYFKYEPSYNPFRGSHVIMFNFADDLKPQPKNPKPASSNFDTVDEQLVKQSQSASHTSAEPVTEQAVVPSINNTNKANIQNNSNGLNLPEPEKKIEESDQGLKPKNIREKEESCAKEEKNFPAIPEDENVEQPKSPVSPNMSFPALSLDQKPAKAEIMDYFSQHNFPELEANKFFNYFNSIGWLVGGRTPMLNWQSAAQNWILNAQKYQPEPHHDRTTNLNNATNKDYAEPL